MLRSTFALALFLTSAAFAFAQQPARLDIDQFRYGLEDDPTGEATAYYIDGGVWKRKLIEESLMPVGPDGQRTGLVFDVLNQPVKTFPKNTITTAVGGKQKAFRSSVIGQNADGRLVLLGPGTFDLGAVVTPITLDRPDPRNPDGKSTVWKKIATNGEAGTGMIRFRLKPEDIALTGDGRGATLFPGEIDNPTTFRFFEQLKDGAFTYSAGWRPPSLLPTDANVAGKDGNQPFLPTRTKTAPLRPR